MGKFKNLFGVTDSVCIQQWTLLGVIGMIGSLFGKDSC